MIAEKIKEGSIIKYQGKQYVIEHFFPLYPVIDGQPKKKYYIIGENIEKRKDVLNISLFEDELEEQIEFVK